MFGYHFDVLKIDPIYSILADEKRESYKRIESAKKGDGDDIKEGLNTFKNERLIQTFRKVGKSP
jgi:hypothetical protein